MVVLSAIMAFARRFGQMSVKVRNAGEKAMSLAEVLSIGPSDGVETDWLPLACLSLPDGRLALADPVFMYQVEPVILPPGVYALLIKLIGHRGHRTVSKLRVVSGPGGEISSMVTSSPVDSAQVGVGDFGSLSAAIERLDSDAYEAKLSETHTDDPVGLLHWDNSTPMYFVSSGYGDGRYGVCELRSGPHLVGVEVDFTAEDDS